jgi:pilus assembly protein CpaC
VRTGNFLSFTGALLAGLLALGETPAALLAAQAAQTSSSPRDLMVYVGKSLVVDSPVNIQRVSVANGEMAEAIAVTPREVLINGKAPGETSMIIWQVGGGRLFFDLDVRAGVSRVEGVRQELRRELPGEEVTFNFENNTVFLRGRVKDLTTADRAVAIVGSLGKVVNLLNVDVPPVEEQILLRVRFANVDRAASQELGANLFSLGALNTPGSISTGQFSPPRLESEDGGFTATVSDALNIFLFRPDLNLGATIRALQNKRMLEMLAEPNVLAINGKPASFLAGGEFPFPTLQGGGAGLGAVTVQFREFGIRINFLPTLTPRGTIRMQVTPEVSSLDFANGLVVQGFTIPALSTRRVVTEVELESGQSFLIAGLLDNRTAETLTKIPGIGDIPLLGKLFQSKSWTRNNTELLVVVTPELVRPIPQGQPVPSLEMPLPFMKDGAKVMPRTPGMDVTGPVPVKPKQETMPVEQLQQLKAPPAAAAPAGPQIMPILIPQQLAPPPAAPPGQSPVVPLPAPSGGANR